MTEQLSSPDLPDSYADHPIDHRVRAWAVRRSNGDIEKNWIEEGRGVKDGVEFARVIKLDSNGQALSKDVSLEALRSLRDELNEEKLKERRKEKVANLALESIGVEGPREDIEQKIKALSEADKVALWQYATALHDYEINNSLSKMSPEAREVAADYREAWQRRRTEEE